MCNIKLDTKINSYYTTKELNPIDYILSKGKARAKSLKPGKEFSRHIKKITK